MAGREGPYRRDYNSTDYIHPNEENLMNLHKAMDYNDDGEPIIRTSIGSESINITGNVNIPGEITVVTSEEDPLITHTHIYDENDVEYSDSNPFTIDGTVSINQPVAVTDNGSSLTVDGAVSIIGNVNVTQGTDPWIVSDGGSSITVDGTVGLDAATLAALENITVTGNVSIDSLPEVEIKNDVGNPIPISGNVNVDNDVNVTQGTVPWVVTGNVQSTFGLGSDAFGRLKVAQPQTLFESQHRYEQNDKFYTVTTGSGTTSYNADSSSIDMTVTTASGDSVVRETKRVFPYQPGKALEIYNTFTMAAGQTNLRQRVGYFSTENGIFLEKTDDTLYWVLRSKSSGSIVESRIAQSNWNVDILNGSGTSGITLDTTKALIQYIDIEWLGVGTVRCGFVINGEFIIAHKFHHSNIGDSTYMTTAALPVRYEIENTGAIDSGASLEHICNSVVSNGGYTPRGIQNVVGRNLTYYTASTAGTYYHLVSIRLDSTRLDDVIIPTDINVLTDSNQNLQFKLVTGATFATPLVFTNSTNSVEYSVTNSAVTNQGKVLATRYIVNKGESRQFTREELEVLQLERDNNGAIVLSLIATADSNNTSMSGNISWIEPLRGR